MNQDPQTPKNLKLKFNRSNFITGLFLMALVSLVGNFALNPKADSTMIFYVVCVLITARLFPYMEVVDADSENKKPNA